MKKSTANISTLVAVGGTLVSLPAAALELGEVQVRSHLGQPLRASVAYALAPTEALSNTCVSIQGGRLPGGLPGIGEAAISVANGVISITGKTAIHEPLVGMRLNVRCPYAAQISRDYTMLVDPAGIINVVNSAPAKQPVAVPSPATPKQTAPVTAERRRVNAEPVVGGTRYQVQHGDSLSEIAQRIADRPVGLWPAVNGIFAANPEAFLGSDPNKLKTGSWLTIPDFGADQPLSVAPASSAAADSVSTTPADETSAATAQDSSVYTGMTADQANVPAEQGAATAQTTAVVEPVEVPAERIIDIPDTRLGAPAATAATPNVPTARVQRTPPAESGTNWFIWLGGAGLALIALLMLFGRMVRNRFNSSPIGEAVPAERRQPDSSRTLEIISEMEVTIDELDETHENIALDADLIIGSGLQENNEIDVAQDFGFAATTQLDHEFTEEMMESDDEEDAETDIIPPLNIEAHSILESEVMPDEIDADVDDDYDMSVIVDATKMPNPEDVTLRDLEAIPVDTDDESLVTGDYTVSAEVDYTVLEQDYEDELSATQALNEEIARAAAELTVEMETQKSDTSLASITALDVTAQLPANNDETFDAEESSDVVADDEATAIMPAKRGA